MKQGKVAIILDKTPYKFNKDNYELVIGSEYGSEYVLSIENEIDTFHIGDFDSVSEEFKSLIMNKDNSKVLDPFEKIWSDGEEAIRYAIELGYCGNNIDVYVNPTERMDHFSLMLSVLRKYESSLISDGLIVNVSPAGGTINIRKTHHHLSAIFYEEANIKTNGLRWDINDKFDSESGTLFISNEFINNEVEITTDKKVIFIQTEDK